MPILHLSIIYSLKILCFLSICSSFNYLVSIFYLAINDCVDLLYLSPTHLSSCLSCICLSSMCHLSSWLSSVYYPSTTSSIIYLAPFFCINIYEQSSVFVSSACDLSFRYPLSFIPYICYVYILFIYHVPSR